MERNVSLADTVRALLEGGTVDARCRLCLGDARQARLPLHEPVLLQRSYCPPALPLADILAAVVGISPECDPLRSNVLCLSCAGAAIDAYVFREFCTHSQRLWTRAQRSLVTCDLAGLADDSPPGATVYIVLGERSTRVMVDKRARSGGGQPSASRAARRVTTLSSRRERGAAAALQCAECGRTFTSEHLLRRHTEAHARGRSCSDCGRTFLTRFKYHVHRDRVHAPKTVPCANCPRRFASAFLLAEHTDAVHTYGECKVCGAAYTTRKALRDHERAHVTAWVCTCGRSYRYREGLRVHEKRCRPDGVDVRVFHCGECDKSYAFKHTLQQHMRFAHGPEPIRCDVCRKKFLTALALRNHVSTHTGVKHYSCAECGDTFVSSTTLTYHVRARHTHEKPFPCDECPESFITSFRRLEHKRRRHGAPAPSCSLCGARFTTRACLRRHLRRHHDKTVSIAGPA